MGNGMVKRERLRSMGCFLSRACSTTSTALSLMAFGGLATLLVYAAISQRPSTGENLKVAKVRTVSVPADDVSELKDAFAAKIAETRRRRAVVPAPSPPAKEPPRESPKELPPQPQPLPQPPPEVAPVPMWTDAEVTAALAQCVKKLAPIRAEVDPQSPVRAGQCGTPAPILLKKLGEQPIQLQPAAVMNCGLAEALHKWVEEILQPAARDVLGSPVVKLIGTSSYVCRNRNGEANGPISEHAFANALDISGFQLADGRTISLLQDWGPVARDREMTPPAPTPAPTPAAKVERKKPGPMPSALAGPKPPAEPAAELTANARFLRRIHAQSCRLFGTVLGPEANEAHRNHLHLDLKARRRGYCQ
ncbi:MAG: extensin family protein [Hyphomicrobiaceae bacterium]|nr:MAG: extensin family protein [Hyphomicrobiaceae bacterium]